MTAGDPGPVPRDMWAAVGGPDIRSYGFTKPAVNGSGQPVVAKDLLQTLKSESLQDRKPDAQEAPQQQPEINARWFPKKITELVVTDECIRWLWGGFIAPGMITLLTGLWKAGKSTMLAHVLRALDGSATEFAGQVVSPGKALVISEEAERHWVTRRDSLGLGDHISIMSRPFMFNPDLRSWNRLLEHVAVMVRVEGFDLVVFDSLPNLWPVRDENSAPEVKAAMLPMNRITEAGAGILCVAHPKKGDAGEGQATRGSGALPSFVDVIVELRRYDAERREDTRRVLTTYSRFDETPIEVVLDYTPQVGYNAQGTRADARTNGRHDIILAVVTWEKSGQTTDEILADWPENSPKPSRRTLAYDLDYMAGQQGDILRHGAGRRNDPYRYHRVDNNTYLASSISIGLQETIVQETEEVPDFNQGVE